MCKKLAPALVLLTAATWVYAQAPQSTRGQTPATTASGQTRVEGCLEGSNGIFTLRAANGTVYQLTGDTSRLSEHVGHEVRITGRTSGSSTARTPNATIPGASAATSPIPMASRQIILTVSSVRHISRTCKFPVAR
jgi:hypothetical protein